MSFQLKGLLSIFSVLGLLTACASSTGQVDPAAHFDTQNENALMLLGLDVPRNYKDLTIKLRQFDPITGEALDKEKEVKPSNRDLSNGRNFIVTMTRGADMPSEKDYYVFELEPGNWFIEHIRRPVSDGFTAYASVTMLNKGTIAFQTSGGQILYLGEYATTGANALDQELHVNEPNLGKAKSYLKNFANIQGEPMNADVSILAYDCPLKRNFLHVGCDLKNLTLEVNAE